MNRLACFGRHHVPIYILTLRNAQRLSRLSLFFPEVLNSDIERFLFQGLNGKALWAHKGKRWRRESLEKIKALGFLSGRSTHPSLRKLNPAEVAIALSFLSMLQDLIASGENYALFLEDDANLLVSSHADILLEQHQTPQILREKIIELLNFVDGMQWDVIRLGACFARDFFPLARFELGKNSFEFGTLRFSLGNHAFFITREAAAVFLRECVPMSTTIDHAMTLIMQKNNMRHYAVNPHLIGQDLLLNPKSSNVGYAAYERIIMKLLQKTRKSPESIIQNIARLKKIFVKG
jgi:GR25 family glycosyltransferase involved in LPS biosynthesis